MPKPIEPRTSAQRRAVALLREHGRVYVATRTGGVSYPNPNDVSRAMSVWLQAAGWAKWDLTEPVGFLAIIHQDTHQTYDAVTDPHDSFVTHCTCGHTTRGMDPDDADARMMAHTHPEDDNQEN